MLHMKEIMDALVPDTALLLAGGAGKNRLIGNMRFIGQKDMLKNVERNDLIVLTGPALMREKVLEEIVRSVPTLISGVLINTKFYTKSVPVPLVMKYEKLQISLLTLAWEADEGELEKFLFHKLLQSPSQEDDQKYKRFVLEQLLHERYPPYVDYDELFHTEPSDAFNVAVVEIEQGQPSELAELAELFRTKIPALYVTVTEWYGQQEIIILYSSTPEADCYTYQQELESLLQPFAYAYKIGLSYNSARWENLAFTYEEARMSIFISTQLCRPAPFAAAFQDMYLLKIIKSVPNTKLLEEYVHTTLGKLAEYDKKNGADSLEFLKLWIMYNGNTKKIFSALFLHRNTVNYRINKIKEILGYSELNYPVICNLCFAYLVRRALRLEE